MAVSNMPGASEKKVTSGREVEFQPTPLMSSYLVVFCGGEFDTVESEVDGVKLRITTTKGKAESARYALEATRSEERRVGKEWRAEGWPEHEKKNRGGERGRTREGTD